MRITKESDYALRIVTALALSSDVLDAARLSEDTGVTLSFTLKILHKLLHGGVVASKKGAKGGYFLAVAPEKLTMKQVIELMEGPIVLSRCIGSPEVCSQQATNQANCRFRHIFQEVGETVARTLDGVTIASLTRIDGKAGDATNEI